MEVGRDAVTEVQITDQFNRIQDNFENTRQYWYDEACIKV